MTTVRIRYHIISYYKWHNSGYSHMHSPCYQLKLPVLISNIRVPLRIHNPPHLLHYLPLPLLRFLRINPRHLHSRNRILIMQTRQRLTVEQLVLLLLQAVGFGLLLLGLFFVCRENKQQIFNQCTVLECYWNYWQFYRSGSWILQGAHQCTTRV